MVTFTYTVRVRCPSDLDSSAVSKLPQLETRRILGSILEVCGGRKVLNHNYVPKAQHQQASVALHRGRNIYATSHVPSWDGVL